MSFIIKDSKIKKICLIAPKKLSPPSYRFDYAFWNFYLPLLHLGHSVDFFDTTEYGNEDLKNYIEKNEPDILFCIMTGDSILCPDEPWDTVLEETKKGKRITFNWFCDDSYRFDSFSKLVCKNFHYCSTPEQKFVNLYKNINYTNIIYSTWHANLDIYSTFKNVKKNIPVSFIGGLHGDRLKYMNFLKEHGISVFCPNTKVSFEDMLCVYSQSLICLNFSKDATCQNTQMKARMFEVPSINSLLLTEHTDDLSSNFIENLEVMSFTSEYDLLNKINQLLNSPSLISEISKNGFNRVQKDHNSKIRLSHLLHQFSHE